MRSELFRLPMELAGVPVFGMGLLLGLLIAAAAISAAVLVKRGTKPAQLAAQAPMLLVLCGVIVLLPRLFPDGVPIRGYGLMLLIAAVSGIGLVVHRAQQNGLSADVIYGMVVWMFLLGIAGARAFFVIEYWETRFVHIPWPERLGQMLLFTEGGLVVYGSLIGGALAFLAFCWKHKLPTLAMADMLAPGLVLGLAIGRLGCLLNGCCYGGACEQPWGVTFPIGSPAYVDQMAAGKVQGLFLYEDLGPEGRRVVLENALEAGKEQSDTVVRINEQKVDSLASANQILNHAYWTGETVQVELADGRTASATSRSLPVHPTQVYSAVNAGLLALVTWLFYPYRRHDGAVILLLLTLYPISRFVLEQIRVDEAAIFGTGLSISQNVSIGLFVSALVGWLWLKQTTPRPAA